LDTLSIAVLPVTQKKVNKRMIRVGVTGGIGSGKSTVCKIWDEMGAYVLYADDLAKKIMKKDPEIKQEIVKHFGVKSYDKEGNLNRPYLADKAFREGMADVLNEIVHPAVYKEIARIADEAEKNGYPVFVKEAALLLKNGRPEDLDYVVIVTSRAENRIERVVRRDGVDELQVIDRMKKQQDFNDLSFLADYIIENNGSLDQLKAKAREIYLKILE